MIVSKKYNLIRELEVSNHGIEIKVFQRLKIASHERNVIALKEVHVKEFVYVWIAAEQSKVIL